MPAKNPEEPFDDRTVSRLDALAEDTYRAARGEDAPDGLPSSGLLSFYDRLRPRVLAAVERRGGKLGSRATEALLLVPDVFMLMLRLALDKEVPKPTRVLLASTLAYFVMPIDLLPEAAVGAPGYLDDLVLALRALSQAFDEDLEPLAEKYWSGAQPVRTVAGDVLRSADSLLGSKLYDRVRALLEKRGVRVE